jgi:hypothetical protein
MEDKVSQGCSRMETHVVRQAKKGSGVSENGSHSKPRPCATLSVFLTSVKLNNLPHTYETRVKENYLC